MDSVRAGPDTMLGVRYDGVVGLVKMERRWRDLLSSVVREC